MTLFVGKSPSSITFCKKHKHNCWEIVIPIMGNGFLEAKDTSLEFRCGCVYVTPPNMVHSLRSDNGFTDVYIYTNFINLNPNKVTIIYDIPEISALGKLILGLYEKKEQGHTQSIDCTLKLIKQLIYERLQDMDNSVTSDIKNYLIDNISNPAVSMCTLSKKFGYNNDYLRRIFKKELGVTPLDYLDELRLSRAKELLQNMPIYTNEQIAELCGFNDPFYFSRFFKKKTGISPKEFRKN